MDDLVAARALMGISLGFHIMYATIGIGLPFMLLLAEGLSLKTGDELYHELARRWIRPAAVLFAIGAVSGTILSFELGLLWPRFMEFSGPLIGLAFWMEGYAFFTEAIFLALYIYGEHRLSRRALFLCTIPLSIAAAISAVFVISANAWMSTPAGFTMINGTMSELQPFKAFANPAWAHEAVHGTLAAYVATAFGMSGVYAAALLRGRGTEHNRRALKMALAVGGISIPLMFVSGDWAAAVVASHQKPKFAAMEAHFKTTKSAPLIIGGWPDPETQQVHYGIAIPKLLSILAHRDPNAEVVGLADFPPGTTPDPRLVHPFFDLMVGSFFLMLTASLCYWWTTWRKKEIGRPLLILILVAAPFGMIALESGWMVTEFGRQPWAIQGVMRVADGVTPNSGVGVILGIFVAVYLALTAGMLTMLFRKRPGGKGVEVTREGENVHT